MNLSTLGLPVQIVAPQTNAGALAGLRPIQLGGSPIQISPLAAWNVPTPQPYIANALASLGQSIGAGIQERQKRKDYKEEKEAERIARKEEKEADRLARAKEKEELAKEKKLDRESNERIAATKERLKGASVTGNAAQEAEDWYNAFGEIPSKAKIEKGPSTLLGEPKLDLPKEQQSGEQGIGALTGAQKSEPEPAPRSEPERKQEDILVGPASRSVPALLAQAPPPPAGRIVVAQPPPAAVPVAPPAAVPVAPAGVLSSTEKPQEKEKPKFLPVNTSVYRPKLQNITDFTATKEIMDKNQSFEYTIDPEPLIKNKDGTIVPKYIKKADIEEKKREELEKKAKAETANVSKEVKIIGQALAAHPEYKQFISPNGMRAMTDNFIGAYNTVVAHPEAAGVSDVDLIDMYVRAATGGKPTEAQFHAAETGKSWGEILGLKLKDKPLSGAKLSQGQRDQMLRTMLEMYNHAAEKANQVSNRARKMMTHYGEKNEDFLPQDYVTELMLKSDAKELVKKNKERFAQLTKQLESAKSDRQKSLIEEQLKEIVQQSEHLSEKLFDEQFTDSNILGFKQYKKKSQGFLGGGGLVIDAMKMQQVQEQL